MSWRHWSSSHVRSKGSRVSISSSSVFSQRPRVSAGERLNRRQNAEAFGNQSKHHYQFSVEQRLYGGLCCSAMCLSFNVYKWPRTPSIKSPSWQISISAESSSRVQVWHKHFVVTDGWINTRNPCIIPYAFACRIWVVSHRPVHF